MKRITKNSLRALEGDLRGKITKLDYESRIIDYFNIGDDKRLAFMPETVDISFIFISKLNDFLSKKEKQDYWGEGAKELAQLIITKK